MRKLLLTLAFCVLCAAHSFADGNGNYLWCSPHAVISDYVDYRPGEAVIRRDYWNYDRGMGICKQDTVLVSNLVGNIRGHVGATDIVGAVVDTLMNKCDSASVDSLCRVHGINCHTSWLTVCDGSHKVYAISPIEVYRDSLDLLSDTLVGFVYGKAVAVKDNPVSSDDVASRALLSGELVRFICDEECGAVDYDYAYVESGDSVMLCSKDSVLRRNGVCLDLQALRDTAGSVNVRPWPKEDDASVDSAPRVARTTRFSRFGSMLKMEIAKAGMLEVSAVDGKILRRAPVFPGERWLDLSAFAPGFLAVRVGGASTCLYWEGSGK